MRKISIVLIFVLIFSTFSFVGCAKDGERTFYDIEVTLDGRELIGKQTVNFYNDNENALNELRFNLFGNAFRQGATYNPISPQYIGVAYPNGIDYGKMEILKVYQGKVDLEYDIIGEDENILSVKLMEEVFPNERVSVEIEYRLELANVVSRTGYTEKSINLANFYPILCCYDNGFYECNYYSIGDPFYSDCANYTVTLRCDADYVIASSGKLCKKTSDKNVAMSVYKIDNARSFAFVLSKDFESISDLSLGVEISYYFYDDKTPQKALESAVKAVKLFTELFGSYPYETYSVVQTRFVQGGMEHPALVMISDNLEQSAYLEVVAHETAHQWWQGVVGNNEIEYGFLDEGLAEYSVVLFYENYPEYNLKRQDLIESSEKTYKIFCTVSDKVFGKVNTVMKRSLKEFKSEYEYVNMAYIKPCIMYDYLRNSIGDKAFFSGLKRYYAEYSFKNATPDDLVGVFERCGADTNGFFDSFFNGKVII